MQFNKSILLQEEMKKSLAMKCRQMIDDTKIEIAQSRIIINIKAQESARVDDELRCAPENRKLDIKERREALKKELTEAYSELQFKEFLLQSLSARLGAINENVRAEASSVVY